MIARSPAPKRGQGPDRNLPGLYRGSEVRVQRVMDDLTRRKGAGETFLGMVPEDYRMRVRGMADEAYPLKGAGRSREDFREAMALNWLTKRAVFTEIGVEAGLKQMDYVDKDTSAAVIALTESGSILAFSEPDSAGVRDTYYVRIKERVDTNIPGASPSYLKTDPALRERCQTTTLVSSPLIGILSKPDAPIDVRGTVANMSQSFIDVDHRTIY